VPTVYRDYMVRFLIRIKGIKGEGFIDELYELKAISKKEYYDIKK
jgi:hypothetical protein